MVQNHNPNFFRTVEPFQKNVNSNFGFYLIFVFKLAMNVQKVSAQKVNYLFDINIH